MSYHEAHVPDIDTFCRSDVAWLNWDVWRVLHSHFVIAGVCKIGPLCESERES